MELNLLLRGLITGFSIAAPVGPIGVLCIRRTLAEGRAVGLLSGLGAASADAIYGTIAAFGLTFLSDSLVKQQLWLQLLGCGYLLWLGLKNLLQRPPNSREETAGVNSCSSPESTSKPEPDAASLSTAAGTPAPHRAFPTIHATNSAAPPVQPHRTRQLASAFGSTFILTLTNPVTILSFTAVFAGLGLAAAGSHLSAAVMVLGVFTGSALWWLLLSGSVSLFRSRFTPDAMLWVNRVSGLILTAFGVYILVKLLF